MKHKLKDRYLRIDCNQSSTQECVLGIDIATAEAKSTIINIAEKSYQQYTNNEILREMLSNNKPQTTF